MRWRIVDYMVLLVGWMTVAIVLMEACAPRGYIEGQSACEIENSRLKEELNDIRVKELERENQPSEVPEEAPVLDV